MPSAKVNKIDASGTYPCPCRRQGHLSPIMLMDALGCEQCHHIFIVKPDGYTIEQCSAHYPHRTWYWTGRHWHPSRSRNRKLYWSLLLLSLCVGLIIVIWLVVL
ncbi:MAG: hypothetical protein HC851_14790 [Acaryochloris sp. RU_4_1]|nr:hypothetical protein [Acaryochloris sp. RU_4_1]NJR55824.1 hypothetical protein [Acaryochloris sp. CRU_2_0]